MQILAEGKVALAGGIGGAARAGMRSGHPGRRPDPCSRGLPTHTPAARTSCRRVRLLERLGRLPASWSLVIVYSVLTNLYLRALLPYIRETKRLRKRSRRCGQSPAAQRVEVGGGIKEVDCAHQRPFRGCREASARHAAQVCCRLTSPGVSIPAKEINRKKKKKKWETCNE